MRLKLSCKRTKPGTLLVPGSFAGSMVSDARFSRDAGSPYPLPTAQSIPITAPRRSRWLPSSDGCSPVVSSMHPGSLSPAYGALKLVTSSQRCCGFDIDPALPLSALIVSPDSTIYVRCTICVKIAVPVSGSASDDFREVGAYNIPFHAVVRIWSGRLELGPPFHY